MRPSPRIGLAALALGITLTRCFSAWAASGDAVELPEIVIDTAGDQQGLGANTRAALDAARSNLLPAAAASIAHFDRKAVEALPEGDNTPFDKLLLQAPGVSQDTAASHPDFHIRNEYSNVQYRIDGVLLPDGLSGLGAILDTSFVDTLSLLTGTLPAQYGLRTSAVVDIKARAFGTPGGTVGVYGGSDGTIRPTFDYGGSIDKTQYFVSLVGFASDRGIENPTPSSYALHDRTVQGKAFFYGSTLLSDSARLSVIAGTANSQFQIPNNPDQTPLGDYPAGAVNSGRINERETDRYSFGIAALQTTAEKLDTQIALFTRFSQVHFVPDVGADLAFNDVASDVAQNSALFGVQGDGSYRLGDKQTLRAGFGVTAERTHNDSILTVLPLDAAGAPLPTPVMVYDNTAKLGVNVGGYVQDEIQIAKGLTLNAGLRFDQLDQYVTAHQLSPRLGLVYKPDDITTLHAGYARYFTPPLQSAAAPPNLSFTPNTTLAPAVDLASPVLPERSHYFDVGVDRMVTPSLSLGADLYYKLTTDMLDDGQFGPALVLRQLNYARSYSEGAEFKARYQSGDLAAYGNISTGRTKDTRPVSNQYLLDADEYAYINRTYIFSDDTQLISGSAGISYNWNKTHLSADVIYGSGLRAGFANLDHVPAYTQVNLGITRDFNFSAGAKPLSVRFDIVNLFDTIYELRDGSGIGVFAPQYGPRRGFFLGLSKAL